MFRDHAFIGNSRIDVCSESIKREVAARWLAENAIPGDVVLLGYTVEEMHRFEKARPHYEAMGYRCEAPLCERPWMTARDIKDWARAEGLAEQRLYKLGFPHANCGGFCARPGNRTSATC